MSDLKKWSQLFKQTNMNLEEINQSLLKHVDNVERENVCYFIVNFIGKITRCFEYN